MPLNIVISGASGLVGSALVPFLSAGGHRVSRLVRRKGPAFGEEIAWEPESGRIDRDALEGKDAVIHLAGENIADKRWSEAQKARIKDSRIQTTTLLSETLARLDAPPKVLLSASAIGFYGDRGEEELTEESPPGEGFLAEVCRDWEAATKAAAEAGIRVVCLRFGVILSKEGGALKKMLTPFRLGMGGKFGSGKQYMSWIAIDDVCSALLLLLSNEDVQGPVNLTAPNPVTNQEFTRTLGRVLSRPTVMALPAFAARLALGEMADEMLLSGQRVLPRKLLSARFTFGFPDLEGALRHLLGR